MPAGEQCGYVDVPLDDLLSGGTCWCVNGAEEGGRNLYKPELRVRVGVTRRGGRSLRLEHRASAVDCRPWERYAHSQVAAMEARIVAARDLRRDGTSQAALLLERAELEVWPQSSLIDAPTLADVTTYLARGRQSQQGPLDHYLIKTQHVQMGEYIRTPLTLDPGVAARIQPEALVRSGDVLIACSAAGCLGRVAQYTDADGLASTDTHVAIARPDDTKVLPDYLYAYLRGAQGQHQLRSRERGDWQREKVGFRLTELNLADLRQVPVPLPSLESQERILAELAQVRDRVAAVRELQAGHGRRLMLCYHRSSTKRLASRLTST